MEEDANERAQHEAERKVAALHYVGWETGAGATIWARAIRDQLALHESARENHGDLEGWERLHGSALMLVVAIDQVLRFESRVRRLTGHETSRETALTDAIADALDGWTAAIEKAVSKSERDILATLAAFERAEVGRSRQRTALAWLRAYTSGGTLPRLDHVPRLPTGLRKHPNDTASYWTSELVAGIRAAVEHATVEAQAKRGVEAEAQAAADAARAAELRELHREVAGRE